MVYPYLAFRSNGYNVVKLFFKEHAQNNL